LNKGNSGFRINEIHAFLTVDQDDNEEGIVTMQSAKGKIPLVSSGNYIRLAQLKSIAEEIAKQEGKEIKLVRFTVREEIETINGK
jgi:hypothetical protein